MRGSARYWGNVGFLCVILVGVRDKEQRYLLGGWHSRRPAGFAGLVRRAEAGARVAAAEGGVAQARLAEADALRHVEAAQV